MCGQIMDSVVKLKLLERRRIGIFECQLEISCAKAEVKIVHSF